MTEDIANQDESYKIEDEELSAVAGGKGYWNPWNETRLKRNWVYAGSDLSFEDWLKTRESPDYLKARDLWLAANSPQDLTYFYDNGNVWTEPYKE